MFPNLVIGIQKLWGSVSSKDEVAAGLAAMQLIYDMSEVGDLLPYITSGLTHAKPNVQLSMLQGIVEATERNLSLFAEPLATDGIIGILINLMDANAGIVRDAVPAALGALYRYNKDSIVARVSGSKLRRDQLAALNKLFDMAEEEGDVFSKTTQAYEDSLIIQSLARSSSASSLASSSSTVGRSGSAANVAAGVKTITVNSEEELRKEMASIAKELKDADKRANDWEKHLVQLRKLQGLVVGGAIEFRNFMECLIPAYINIFKQLLPMSRAQISDETTKALNIMATYGGHHVSSFFEKIMKILVEKLHATNAIIVEQGFNCISTILRAARPNVGVLIADLTIKDLHASTRLHCIQLIHQLISEGEHEYTDKYAETFQTAVKAALSDSDSETRTNARATYAAFHKRWPQRGMVLWEGLEGSIRSALEREGKAPTRAGSDSILSAHGSSAPKLTHSGSSIPHPLHSSPVHLDELSSSVQLPTVKASTSSGQLGNIASASAASKSVIAPSGPHAGAKREKPPTGHERLPSASRGANVASSSANTVGTATRIAQTTTASSKTANLAVAPKAPQRVVDSSQTPRKLVSSSALGKPTLPPASISKSTSAGANLVDRVSAKEKVSTSSAKSTSSKLEKANISDTASDTSVDSNKVTTSETLSDTASNTSSLLSTPSKSSYSGSSTDTTEFRNIHKRCSLTDSEERFKAFEAMRTLLRTDELPGLWKNQELVKTTLLTTLGRGLVDSQTRVIQACLDILQLISSEHPDVYEIGLDLVATALFQASWNPSLRDDQKSIAQALVVELAEVSTLLPASKLVLTASSSASALLKAAMKALDINDVKIKYATVRSLSLFISRTLVYFDKQPKRVESFIKWLAIKPNAINASIDMTRAVTEVFGHLYNMLGEGFAVPLRTIKFTGQDTVMKKLKIPLVAPKVTSAAKPAAAPSNASITKKTTSASALTGKSTTAKMTAKATGSTSLKTLTKPAASGASSGASSTSSHNSSTVAVAPITKEVSAESKPRPKLTKQRSLNHLSSDRERLRAATLEVANAEHMRHMEQSNVEGESGVDGMNAEELGHGGSTSFLDSLTRTSASVTQTPSVERIREMRAEIMETPNVLATVMAHPHLVSPLTPSMRNATPTFGARGRSTSTPQLRSFKVAGREVDTEPLDEDGETRGNDLFSPIKFRLDSATSPGPSTPPVPTSPLHPTLSELEKYFATLSTSSKPAEPTEWEPIWKLIMSMREHINKLSTDDILLSLNHERLMALMARCLERAQAPTKVRQRACEIISAIRPRIPERDWDIHFATLSEAQRKLVSGFMSSTQRNTQQPSATPMPTSNPLESAVTPTAAI